MALRTYLNRQQLPHTWTDYASDVGAILARAAGIGRAGVQVGRLAGQQVHLTAELSGTVVCATASGLSAV
ncbi:MAG: hypothetical protein JWM76_5155 [Pseudonocardiales bacterium]|nr:hypothetical protein [Pseudonocardiales bacterium]